MILQSRGLPVYQLRRAIGLIASRRGGQAYDLDEDRRYGALVRAIESSIELWPSDARGLLDSSNWRVSRLVSADGAFRKPEIDLDVSITAKDNLIVTFWCPSIVRIGDAESSGLTPSRIAHLRAPPAKLAGEGFGSRPHPNPGAGTAATLRR